MLGLVMSDKKKDSVLDNIKQLGLFIVIGASVTFGFRVVEWLIPAPEVKTLIMICDIRLGDNDCQYLKDIQHEQTSNNK